MDIIIHSILWGLFGALSGVFVWFWRTSYLLDMQLTTALYPLLDPMLQLKMLENGRSPEMYSLHLKCSLDGNKYRSMLCFKFGIAGMGLFIFPILFLEPLASPWTVSFWAGGFVLSAVLSVLLFHRRDWRAIREETLRLKAQLENVQGPTN